MHEKCFFGMMTGIANARTGWTRGAQTSGTSDMRVVFARLPTHVSPSARFCWVRWQRLLADMSYLRGCAPSCPRQPMPRTFCDAASGTFEALPSLRRKALGLRWLLHADDGRRM